MMFSRIMYHPLAVFDSLYSFTVKDSKGDCVAAEMKTLLVQNVHNVRIFQYRHKYLFTNTNDVFQNNVSPIGGV